MNFCVRRWCVRTPTRIPYLTYVNDEEWAFVAPYLTLIRETAPQCTHDLCEVFKTPCGRSTAAYM
jgi:hypothetical protein